MTTEPFADAEIEDCMDAAVARGEFATLEEARAEFLASLERGIKEFEEGGGVDIEVVAAELHQRFRDWPRAAE